MELLVVPIFLALLIGLAVAIQRRDRTARPSAAPVLQKPVVYTNHVVQRMGERGVTKAEIESVLASPSRVKEIPEKESVRLERDFAGKTLRVWVTRPWPARQEIVVKTAAWRYVEEFDIATFAVSAVKGRAGASVQRIEADSQARVTIGPDGRVRVSGGEARDVAAARQMVERAAASAEKLMVYSVGDRVTVPITRVEPEFAMAALAASRTARLHVSKLRCLNAGRRISDLRTFVCVGDLIEVEVEEIRSGKLQLRAVGRGEAQ